jgi:hypothetical protein
MRFLDLAVRHTGSEQVLRFHRGVTVLGPLDHAGRERWSEDLFRTLRGDGHVDTVLSFLDGMGDQIRLVRTADGTGRLYDPVTGDDLTADVGGDPRLLDLLDVLGLDLDGARTLSVVRPSDVAASVGDVPVSAPPAELLETRELLAHVEEEYEAALLVLGKLEALQRESLELDAAIRASAEIAIARQWTEVARRAADLRGERDAAIGAAEVDPAATEAAARVLVAGETFHGTATRASEARAIFGSRRRLTPDALAHALTLPAEVPVQLAELHDNYVVARTARDQLRQQVTDTAASDLPPPSQPFVLALARVPQAELWTRAERAIETSRRISQLSVALGGAGGHQELVAEIETAHEAVDRAERQIHGVGRRPVVVGLVAGVGAAGTALFLPIGAVPLAAAGLWAELRMLRSRAAMTRAEKYEQEVLGRAGFSSWLGFKLRWVETLIDVNARETLQVAELEHSLAMSAWHELAASIAPDAAVAVRDEVERYAAHLDTLRGSGDASDAARRYLLEEVEPAFGRALGALLEIASPFGVDPEHAVSEVAALVFEARSARLQLELEVTEAEERQARDALLTALAGLGIEPAPDLSDLGRHLSEIGEWTRRQDAAAQHGRNGQPARDLAEIEHDLATVEAEVARLHRPGFELLDLEGDLLEPEELELAREALQYEIEDVAEDLPEMDRLTDRLEGLRRRVAVLEQHAGESVSLPEPKEIELYLLGRVATARRVGPDAEPFPLLVDDVLRPLGDVAKRRLLDLLARLGESTQIIYLTQDPEVLRWAQERGESGGVGVASLAANAGPSPEMHAPHAPHATVGV